jgi:hypothetical protein
MRWLTALLTWIATDPAVVDACAARSAAAVECAYASMSVGGKKQGENCPTGKCPPSHRN